MLLHVMVFMVKINVHFPLNSLVIVFVLQIFCRTFHAVTYDGYSVVIQRDKMETGRLREEIGLKKRLRMKVVGLRRRWEGEIGSTKNKK